MFEIKKTLFPWAAFKYDKIIIEIRELVRVEKSAIIHCSMMEGGSLTSNRAGENGQNCFLEKKNSRLINPTSPTIFGAEL